MPITIDFDQPVPLFPLPNSVLLPHATVPLHIFEPRYVAMVHETLRGESLVAMAVFEGEAWQQDYAGKPPVRPFVCVGAVTQHTLLEDGRFNLLLQGVCRARIVEEVPSEPYRTAVLEPTELKQPMEIDLTDHRQRLDELLRDPLLAQLATVHAIHKWLTSEVPTSVMVDLAVMTTFEDLEQRYDMLAQPDPAARAEYLERYLRQTRQTLEVAERYQPGSQPDYMSLN